MWPSVETAVKQCMHPSANLTLCFFRCGCVAVLGCSLLAETFICSLEAVVVGKWTTLAGSETMVVQATMVLGVLCLPVVLEPSIELWVLNEMEDWWNCCDVESNPHQQNFGKNACSFWRAAERLWSWQKDVWNRVSKCDVALWTDKVKLPFEWSNQWDSWLAVPHYLGVPLPGYLLVTEYCSGTCLGCIGLELCCDWSCFHRLYMPSRPLWGIPTCALTIYVLHKRSLPRMMAFVVQCTVPRCVQIIKGWLRAHLMLCPAEETIIYCPCKWRAINLPHLLI